MKVRVEKNWIRCGACGHKLCRIVGDSELNLNGAALEIKCHSCKEINVVEGSVTENQGGEKDD